jgi:hypothetical protein
VARAVLRDEARRRVDLLDVAPQVRLEPAAAGDEDRELEAGRAGVQDDDRVGDGGSLIARETGESVLVQSTTRPTRTRFP